MGMFDRLYDEKNQEWQTKALGRSLDAWCIGDPVPVPFDCQIEAIGGRGDGYEWAYATVRGGVLRSIQPERDESLPRIPYGGLWATPSIATPDTDRSE